MPFATPRFEYASSIRGNKEIITGTFQRQQYVTWQDLTGHTANLTLFFSPGATGVVFYNPLADFSLLAYEIS